MEKRIFFISVLGVAMVVIFVQVYPKAQAYDGARLIDNSIFRNTSTMSKSEIQSFLERMGSGLKSKSFKLDCYGAESTEREWYTAAGAPCDQTIPASHIIYYAGKVYDINPQAILATLQKEQSLITTTNPTSWQLDNAMGYGCPTEGSCSSTGFYYQIDFGVWVLRYHYERANGNNTWWNNNGWTCGTEKNFYKPHLYPGTNVTFYDEDDVAYRTHRLFSAATSALYCYTPHAYNNPDGLFGLPVYGTKGRYYTGSYNFVKFFKLWFGNPLIDTSKDTVFTGDWNGNGEETPAVRRSADFFFDNNNDGTEDASFGLGRTTDGLIVGDWDDDGRDEIGLRRGNVYYLDRDMNGTAEVSFRYGRSTDKTIVGDWDGDGRDTVGVKRGNIYYLNNGHDSEAEIKVAIGRIDDIVFVGDWDDDGRDEIGLRRGNKYYLDGNLNGSAEIAFGMGRTTDGLIIGDWDGDGDDNIGLRRGASYYLDTNNRNSTEFYVSMGRTTDKVVTGDWDGDGNQGIGLKRGSYYYLDDSKNSSPEIVFLYTY
ncbi:MAG: hypothetical protein WD885_02365 [Candidatus Saccharimonadales bacterium]